MKRLTLCGRNITLLVSGCCERSTDRSSFAYGFTGSQVKLIAPSCGIIRWESENSALELSSNFKVEQGNGEKSGDLQVIFQSALFLIQSPCGQWRQLIFPSSFHYFYKMSVCLRYKFCDRPRAKNTRRNCLKFYVQLYLNINQS